MIPAVFATTFYLFPGHRRTQVMVLIGLTATLAPTIGPTLGGWLTQEYSWHWLFLINVPVGAVVAIAIWAFLDIDRPDLSLARRFDFVGIVLMAAFLGSLEYVLEEGNRNDWFDDESIRWLSAVAAVSSVLFFWRMLARPDPLVDLRAFRNVNFSFGCLFNLILGIGLYGSIYVVPLFLARVRLYNSMQIGETMFVTGAVMFVTAPIAGQIARRLDLRIMLAIGLAMFGVAIWSMAILTVDAAFRELFLPQALRGSAIMFVVLPVNQLALGRLPAAALKNASGLFNLMRNLGGAVGLALINYFATIRYAQHSLHLRESVTWSRPAAVQAMGAMTEAMTAAKADDAELATLRRIADAVGQQALTLSYNDVLVLMASAFFAALPLTLLLGRPQAEQRGGD
jgi:DHA2 family multidrug resistance protein